MSLESIDTRLILFFRRISIPVARFALFVVFFWFGFLKVVGYSPASALVQSLFEHTINFIPFNTFLISFGVFECSIGILFLIKGAERIVIPLLFIHMATTVGPLVLLPSVTWQRSFVPTLEGQYIIKNLAIMAIGVALAAHLYPMHSKK